MATSDVTICSNAALMLGADSFNAMDEDKVEATLSSNLFPQVRDAVLRSHPWNCAIKRVALAPDATAPAFDFTYQFSKPGDWMRTLQVGQYGAEVNYRDEGLKFLSNDNPFYLRYIYRNDQVASWDSMLIHAVSLMMKAALAYPLTKSSTLATQCLADATNYLKICRAVDGQDDPPETVGDFPLLAARMGSPASWKW